MKLCLFCIFFSHTHVALDAAGLIDHVGLFYMTQHTSKYSKTAANVRFSLDVASWV